MWCLRVWLRCDSGGVKVMRWCGCDDGVGVEEIGGAGRRLWCGGGGYRRETAHGGGDRVDRVIGSVSELGRKNSSEKFSGGGWPKMMASVAGGWPVPAGARQKK
ncbi:hypothetical protein Tco_1581294 [Tanacetum coccineum]